MSMCWARALRLVFCAVLLVLCTLMAHAARPNAELQRGQLYFSGVPSGSVDLGKIDFAPRLSQYLASREAHFSGWLAPGQGVLIRTRFSRTQQLHRVRQPNGQREQLTYGDDPILNAWPVADPRHPQVLFLRDQGGDEAFQLFHLDLLTSQLSALSQAPSRQGIVIPAAQSGLFAYYSTARNQRDWDLMRLQLPLKATGAVLTKGLSQWPTAAQRVVQSELSRVSMSQALQHVPGTWLPLDWSPDGQWLLALKVESGAVSLPYLVRADGSGEQVALHQKGERAAYMDGRFSRDGEDVFLLSNRGREFIGLFQLSLRSGELSLILDLPYDIESIAQSPDRQFLALVVNEQGYSRLQLYHLPDRSLLDQGSPGQNLSDQNLADRNLPGWQALELAQIPAGVMDTPRFSSDSQFLGFSLSTPKHPRDVYALDLAHGELQRWTHSELGGLSEAEMRMPELIEYPSQGNTAEELLSIPAWYYPPRPGLSRPAAVVILIHGGPEVQARPRFDPLIQFWTQELGLAVLVPNVRGSQGYGSTYLSLDDGPKREDAVADIGALLDWVERRPELDANRVGLYGASYGGYMVLAAMAHYGERVRAGVDLNGISDFVTFLRNTGEYRRQHRRGEYGDERRKEMRDFLRRISPLQMRERIRGPLLIGQGENDPRVPVAQSERMVEALRNAGREVWYLLAKDEGHGFRKQDNRLNVQQTVAQFWCRYLLVSCPHTPGRAADSLESLAEQDPWPPNVAAEHWAVSPPEEESGIHD